MNKILVCTDGSELSYLAVKKAGWLGKLVAKSVVTVLYIHPRIPENPVHGQEKTFELIPILEEGKEILNKAVALLEKDGVKHTTAMLENQNPAEAIIQYAAENKMNIIVIGNRGYSGLTRILLGGVSNDVVQKAKCDVWVVKDSNN